MEKFDKSSVEGVPYTPNTLSRFPFSLIALRQQISCHQVSGKPIIRYFCKTWLQQVFSTSAIRKRGRSGKVSAARMSLSVTKL